jgi:NDP-sugar pyrophosphorylase family protein
MEAMILAAGAGTRLSPLTDRVPKALIEVEGRPLLSHVMERLVAAGATRVIVNAHHHVAQIAAWLDRHAPPAVETVLSPEPDGPYDTGGGLLAAAPLFHDDGPFLLHNVDVLSDIPLDRLLAAHEAARERHTGRLLATLAVQARPTSRRLLFDEGGLVGWENRERDGTVVASERAREPDGSIARWSFTGIHVIEPAMLERSERTGVFSIIAWYLDLVRRGYRIAAVDMSAHDWIDVGTPERLAEARRRLARPR